MHESVQNLVNLKSEILNHISKFEIKNYNPNIIAVSKTFPIDKIKPLLDYGHTHFGENKVQEALDKWSAIKEQNKEIKLHMIGKLQTNKVKFAVKLFDFIHSVDSLKLASKISNEQLKIKKKPKIFIQINIGNETHKSGVNVKDVNNFYDECINLGLDVVGLMCLPPIDYEPKKCFEVVKNKNDELKLNCLSLGMSNDYLQAVEVKSNFIRIGSKIFGQRI
tara:strand:+ start:8561 stop:9223 length:663 start_codon:yes stop_codon:yes gene_type:complete